MEKSTSRIAQLQAWIAEDAADSFSRYALALEYGKVHEVGKMRIEFEYLLENMPTYLPTYTYITLDS